MAATAAAASNKPAAASSSQQQLPVTIQKKNKAEINSVQIKR